MASDNASDMAVDFELEAADTVDLAYCGAARGMGLFSKNACLHFT